MTVIVRQWPCQNPEVGEATGEAVVVEASLPVASPQILLLEGVVAEEIEPKASKKLSLLTKWI